MENNLQLIHLSQIKGGLALKKAVEVLQTSYPADQVVTKIANPESANESYTVEELLLVLKTIVDTQLGHSEGSVAERLAMLQTELQANIDAINNRTIKDRVKIAGTIDAAGEMTLDDYDKVTALDETIDYIVYYDNNKPVRDAAGNNVTYNFGTGALSDVPHVRQVNMRTKQGVKQRVDASADNRTFDLGVVNVKQGTVAVYHQEAEQGGDGTATVYHIVDPGQYYVNTAGGKVLFKTDQTKEIFVDFQYEVAELVFVPLSGIAAVKLFPIGTFTFGQLPEEYLLDNTELNLIAYSEAIDQLVVGLAGDKELVDHIVSLIGTEAVQNAIIDMTEALAKRVQHLEEATDDLGQAIKDGGAICDKKFTEKDIDRQNDILQVNNRIDEIEAVAWRVDEFVGTGQVADFELTAVPTEDAVTLRVNGISYREQKYFTVDRTAVRQTDELSFVSAPKLVWTFTAEAGGFDMASGFDIEACYKVKTTVAPVECIPYPDAASYGS